ncbi:MAG: alpha/beta hydrolase [Nibricoccus sp.]
MKTRIFLSTLLLLASFGFSRAVAAERARETFVLVHGAWGGGWAFKEIDRLLTADGYTVYRPTLTGLGERNHLARADINLTTHVTDVVNVILWEDLHDVVLVGHSYGGMVITGVIDRIPERIKRVVYLDALLPENGESWQSLRPNPPADTKLVNGFFIPPWVQDFSAKPPHDMPQPAGTYTERISLIHSDPHKIKTTYILTVDEGKQPQDDFFFQFYERAQKRGWETTVMIGDHNVQWSKPKELVSLLETKTGKTNP